MVNKEVKIVVPENYEIDRKNSTFECIKFKKKLLTYVNIVENLFNGKKCYYIDGNGIIRSCDVYDTALNNATSAKQLEKLLAINKLMNVAKYLNGDWKPDWDNAEELKHYIWVSSSKNLTISWHKCDFNSAVYFKSKELAQQAIDILGKNTICLALSTDW